MLLRYINADTKEELFRIQMKHALDGLIPRADDFVEFPDGSRSRVLYVTWHLTKYIEVSVLPVDYRL